MRKLATLTVSLALFVLLVFTPMAEAKSDCDKISGTGHTFGVGPGTFQGTVSLNINHETINASVTTSLLGPPTATEDGTLHATTSHTFVFPDGSSLTTLDSAILSPTDSPGLYRLNTSAAITAGSGSYANACGKLTIHGTINLISAEVIWSVTGRICDCG